MKNMVKIVFLLLLLPTTWLYAGFGGGATQQKFLSPDEAFQVQAIERGEQIETTITIAKSIHIYADSLSYTISKPTTLPLTVTKPTPHLLDGDSVYEKQIRVTIPRAMIEERVAGEYTLAIGFEACSDRGICYQPITKEFHFKGRGEVSFIDKMMALVKSGNTDKIADALANESWVFIVLLFFIAGLLMALTPCILPMIPILSSIILQQANQEGEVKKSKAIMISLVYVLSMALMYAIIGVVAGLLDFDLQANLNNPWVILPVAGIFVALAFSLFGYFELVLPASWQAKLNGVSDKAGTQGGLVGTAIMGALSALIVGACTAPIISGAILFIVLTGKALLGGVALFVMGVGAGVPLLLVGAGASRFIPKPGGWMSLVSKFFGVLMLLMALLMLSRLLPSDAKGDQGYSVSRLMAEVEQSSKPVLVDIYKAGCASCKELEEITFPNPTVQEALKAFTFIHIDVTAYTDEDKALLKQYKLFGAPNIIFFDTQNHFLPSKSLTGFIEPERFAKHLAGITSE